jgi:hypothetical protein
MTQANQMLDLDPKLVFDLAARVDPPHVVAANYGLDPQFLLEVIETPHVKKVITAKRRELDEAGFALAMKAKLCYEDLMGDVYRKAKGENATLSGVLEAAKFFRTAAGLDKVDANAGQQEKFSITIQFGGAPQPTTIDVVATRVDLPSPPEFLQKEMALGLSDLAYDEP